MTDLSEFLGELASDSPTPGGGSVAALCGALGAALNSMVANLTIGKKRYADVEKEMKKTLASAETLRLELTQMIDEDAAAFNKFMAALKMPKETEADKASRKTALQQTLVDAATVPLAVMEMCVGVIRLARPVAEHGNVNAVSDAGVAALIARAGVHAAGLNVRINVGGIRAEEHQEFAAKAKAAITDLGREADLACEEVMKIVLPKIS
ncbi:MAG: cyclodeaminase/cyclohydrolase family protein [Candidatus Eisenbacteria sp.]|jgi:glutamate formiminotransferase/formiminotetrahydrofolate cyclodeaminase|nr:cyclodeaminase/cyclohydrolase family protein [Candidatus Eisenbacteria bacterium]MCK5597290.1 cyclodeaminase/cyclohydrolase family protein [Candidatus Eisenbacteria bacterium]